MYMANWRDLKPNPRIISTSAGPFLCPANTSENILVGPIVVPANCMGKYGELRIETLWDLTNNANSKTFRVRFGATGSGTGGSSYTAFSAASKSTASLCVIIRNKGATNSQIGWENAATQATLYTTGTGSNLTSAIDTTIATELNISMTLGVNTDTVNLQWYRVLAYYAN